MQKTLDLFQKVNSSLSEYDENFAEIYSELRDHVVKLLETIFNKAGLFAGRGDNGKPRTEQEQLLFKENELLRARVQHMAATSPKNYSPKGVANSRSKSKPKNSPSPNVEKKLMAITSNSSSKEDFGKTGETNRTNVTGATPPAWKRENSFLKSFTKAEAGNSLKDVMFKPFTEANLVDLITELVGLKKSHDLKTKEAGFPRETMEQFMYGFLKKKYGLQPVVIERVLSVTLAIEEFSETNNTVAAFGLVR